ncbi:class I SAM-dependent methyltransferase [Magnetospirillum sp. SS-4]|uniref:class I SAM-dependent methyltransferase n=1 Tax=Magnetospirillum sp. SS-4 TaxID=2681465 RepID=UPI00137E75F7|nr:class I SAM-dependent methyltransferase [Magnetospirillum sp. SS-4]CAA7614510.1 Methylase involved in ubiquinone/menaquinone biosynthesis [Magnetospirillum sp. SS-4]
MAQTTTGLRSILSAAWAYELLQTLLGTRPMRRVFVNDYVRPFKGARVLDLGCGPASLIEMLPDDIDYTGIDLSPGYIASATAKYGHRGCFHVMDAASLRNTGETFDIIYSFGMLHHIDDDRCRHVFEMAEAMLRPGGRYVTFDPCYAEGQHAFARKIADWDRGDAVRTPDQYLALAGSAPFARIDHAVRHDLWFLPVTVHLMECLKR